MKNVFTMKTNILIYDDDDEILLLCKAILTKYNLHRCTFYIRYRYNKGWQAQ